MLPLATFAPASTHVQLDFALAHFAQEFWFGAQAPSTPALNSLHSCLGANFQSRFLPSTFSGFQLSRTSAPALGAGGNAG